MNESNIQKCLEDYEILKNDVSRKMRLIKKLSSTYYAEKSKLEKIEEEFVENEGKKYEGDLLSLKE